MIVIKATLRDETRRLTFDSHGFPAYNDIQDSLRGIFNLPSGAHPFWTNVLFYPDDSKPSRIKFKQHVCDASEYELAQQPFLRLVTSFPNPALVFTILLSSDKRLNSIHDVHRASTMQAELRALDNHILALEEDMSQRHQLLMSLEAKQEQCRQDGDELGVSFWSDRAEEKRHSLPQLEEQLRQMRVSRRSLAEDLDSTPAFTGGVSLREWANNQERNEAHRVQETNDELAAWQIETNDADSSPFPPLETIFRGGHMRHGHRRPHPACGMPPPPPFPFTRPPHPPIMRSTRDLLRPTEAAAREVGAILDRFLVHFQGQLVDTLDTFASRIAPPSAEGQPMPTEDVPHVPGAFVQPASTTVPVQSDAQVQTPQAPQTAGAPVRKKPSSKLGKGGYRHKHITCDGCLTGIRGMRYKCEQCPDYDLCGSCLPLLHTEELHSPTHTFKAMLHRGLEERIKFGGTEPTRTAPHAMRHPATCDVCSENIVGVRWKCLNCPDWDCCSPCAKSVATTHPGHSFVKLHKPTDYVTTMGSGVNITHSDVICDSCNQTIRGARFKCMHPECPDYDLCERCESKPGPVHPEDHPMLKTKTPLRVKVQSSFDQINEVYDDHHRRYRVCPPGMNRSPCRRSSSGSSSTSTPAFQRGEDYAKAMDAILASMTLNDSVRVPGGYVVRSNASVPSTSAPSVAGPVASSSSSMKASVQTEEEEMAGLATPILPTHKAPAVVDRSTTPVPIIGAFPTTPKKTAATIETITPEVKEAPRSVDKNIVETSYKRSGPTGRPFATPPKAQEMTQVKATPVVVPDVPAEIKEDPIVQAIAAARPASPSPAAKQLKAAPVEREDPITKVIAAAAAPVSREPTDIFTWVRHATIPTGTILPAGAEFTKTWTVRHYADGTDFDFGHVRLVHKTGGLLGKRCRADVIYHQPDIRNGADLEVSLTGLIVPDMPGKEISEMWRFEDDKGVAYGQPLRVRINVEEVSTGESSLASSAVVLPEPTLSHESSVYASPRSNEPEVVAVPEDDAASEHHSVSPSDRFSSSVPASMAGADMDELDASSAFSFSDVEDEHLHTAQPSAYASSRRASSTNLSDDYDFVDEPAHDLDDSTDDGF